MTYTELCVCRRVLCRGRACRSNYADTAPHRNRQPVPEGLGYLASDALLIANTYAASCTCSLNCKRMVVVCHRSIKIFFPTLYNNACAGRPNATSARQLNVLTLVSHYQNNHITCTHVNSTSKNHNYPTVTLRATISHVRLHREQ